MRCFFVVALLRPSAMKATLFFKFQRQIISVWLVHAAAPRPMIVSMIVDVSECDAQVQTLLQQL